MRYLIDGHNLLHALGKLTAGMSRSGLDGARRWLVSHARAAHGGDATVVLDGHPAPRERRDPLVVYSMRATADDVIEDLVKREADPRRLAVVSDDMRLREAARHRGCVSLRCLDYAERHLMPRQAARPTAPETPEKPDAGRMEDWAEVFGYLDDDPRLRGP